MSLLDSKTSNCFLSQTLSFASQMPFHGRTGCPAVGYMTPAPSSFKVKAAEDLFVQGHTFPRPACTWCPSNARVYKPDMLTWHRTIVHEGPQRTIFSPELTTGWTKAFLDLHHNSVSTPTQSYLLLPFHRCQTCIAAWRLYLSLLVPLPFNFHEHFHPIPPSSLAILCPYWHLIPRGPKTDSFSHHPVYQCTLLYSL